MLIALSVISIMMTVVLIYLYNLDLNLMESPNRAARMEMNLDIKGPENVEIFKAGSNSFPRSDYSDFFADQIIVTYSHLEDNRRIGNRFKTTAHIWVEESKANFSLNMTYDPMFVEGILPASFREDDKVTFKVYDGDDKLLSCEKKELDYPINYDGGKEQVYRIKMFWRKWPWKDSLMDEKKVIINWLPLDEFEQLKQQKLKNGQLNINDEN